MTETFKALDVNGDGVLSKEEIRNGYQQICGITQEELDQLITEVDSNANTAINYSEFMVASMNRRDFLTDAKIKACFQLFDRVSFFLENLIFQDNSGMITIAEFQDMLGGKQVSQQKWADALRKADTNNDGAIDFAEFKDIFKKMIQESRQGI